MTEVIVVVLGFYFLGPVLMIGLMVAYVAIGVLAGIFGGV